MDKEINCWIAEYLLRQSHGNASVVKLLEKLDLENDGGGRLRKTAVLRDLWNDILKGTVNERALDSLESLEKLVVGDGNVEGSPILQSMQKAYCAVAADCTVRYLVGVSVKEGRYLDAVTRIWKERIKGLEKRESQLVSSAELKKLEDEIEVAGWDEEVRLRFMQRNTRNEALRLLSEYVAEEWVLMGPPFLAKVSRAWEKLQEQQEHGIESSERGALPDVDMMNCDEKDDDDEDGDDIHSNDKECGNGGEASVGLEKENGPEANELRVEVESPAGASGERQSPEELELTKRKNIEACKNNVLPRYKLVTSHKRRRGAKIVNNDESDTEPSPKINCVPTPEDDKVRKELNKSVLERQSLVTDSLPDSTRVAEAISAETTKRNVNNETMADKENERDADASIQYESGKGECSQKGKHIQTDKDTNGSTRGIGPSIPKKISLMEKNKSARVFEWQDSIDETSEGTSTGKLRPKLPNPRPIYNSPLKLHRPKKVVIRRRRVAWTPEEEDVLRQGVIKFGTGRWSAILNTNPDVFSQRTEVDLKDKWRVMVGRNKPK